MTEATVLDLGTDALKIAMSLAGPMLIAAMVVGIIVSVFQAITQINESTLTFIPKMAAIIGVILAMAPWMLRAFEDYAVGIFGNLGDFLR